MRNIINSSSTAKCLINDICFLLLIWYFTGIATDDQNSTRRLFELDQPSLGMDREYLINGFEDKEVQVSLRCDREYSSLDSRTRRSR
jgi:hypothetical protein